MATPTVGGLFCAWRRPAVLLSILIALSVQACAVDKPQTASLRTFTISLQTESNRIVEVRVWLPPSCDSCNAVIFSHGHGLNYDQYDALLTRWTAAGYLTLAPLHVDSELHEDRHRFPADEYIKLRVQDIGTVAAWLGTGAAAERLGTQLSDRYLVAGHSFGALLAQMAGGATVVRDGTTLQLYLPQRPIGVIAISPPGPVAGYLSEPGWSHIRIPHLVVTGTEDVVPLFAPTWQAHLASFTAGPVGKSYALTFTGMDHYFNGAFGRLKLTDADSASAVDTLNRAILQLADALSQGVLLSAETWSELDSEKVLTETR